ncbi:hypothetical protein HZU75_06380 [Chitinibacter fontanus]|uniref:Lipoprotein n=1 Tax=Chitinibacter fontanus TaxID=1737446 RepID=A0A7D5ZCH1_9NEIS|nr:hypothetical protein [Chitinibacter fontanus]QLI81186.1 hypothetical protein HZU75_06380 [Chitinibacter fontanus]
MKILFITLSILLSVSGCADESPHQYYGTLGIHKIKLNQDMIAIGPEYDEPSVVGSAPNEFPIMRGWGGYVKLPDFTLPNDANRADMRAAWANPTSDTWVRYLVRSSSALGLQAKTKPPYKDFRQFNLKWWTSTHLERKNNLYGLEVYEPVWEFKSNEGIEHVKNYIYTPILYYSKESNAYIICNRTAPFNTCEHRFFVDKENKIEVELNYASHLLKNWAEYEQRMRETIEKFYIRKEN